MVPRGAGPLRDAAPANRQLRACGEARQDAWKGEQSKRSGQRNSRRDERLGRSGKGGRVDTVLTCVRGGSCAAAGSRGQPASTAPCASVLRSPASILAEPGPGSGPARPAASHSADPSQVDHLRVRSKRIARRRATTLRTRRSSPAAHATTFGRAHLGGMLMAGPSADFSHGYARASAQSQQLALWLGFAAGRFAVRRLDRASTESGCRVFRGSKARRPVLYPRCSRSSATPTRLRAARIVARARVRRLTQ
jgi:hypothetical protein